MGKKQASGGRGYDMNFFSFKRMFFDEMSYSQILDNFKIDDSGTFVVVIVISCNLTFSATINPFNSILDFVRKLNCDEIKLKLVTRS